MVRARQSVQHLPAEAQPLLLWDATETHENRMRSAVSSELCIQDRLTDG